MKDIEERVSDLERKTDKFDHYYQSHLELKTLVEKMADSIDSLNMKVGEILAARSVVTWVIASLIGIGTVIVPLGISINDHINPITPHDQTSQPRK
jgi:hypothetical protein